AAGLRRIAFFVIPSAVAFAALGQVIAAALFQSGRFTREDSFYVWGLLAGSLGRLYSSAFYALRDTRTPLRFAVVRVGLTTALGFGAALALPGLLGIPARWGVAGLTASAGVAAWVEFFLLRRALGRRIGPTGLDPRFAARLWVAAGAAALAGGSLALALPLRHPIGLAACVLAAYGLVYVAAAAALGIPEVREAGAGLLGRRAGGR